MTARDFCYWRTFIYPVGSESYQSYRTIIFHPNLSALCSVLPPSDVLDQIFKQDSLVIVCIEKKTGHSYQYVNKLIRDWENIRNISDFSRAHM